jgi:hypothetical protein
MVETIEPGNGTRALRVWDDIPQTRALRRVLPKRLASCIDIVRGCEDGSYTVWLESGHLFIFSRDEWLTDKCIALIALKA